MKGRLEKPHTGSEEKELLEQSEAFRAYSQKRVAAHIFHTFTANDFRNQTLSFSPELHRALSPEVVSEVFSNLEKEYALETETAREGISSDAAMASYMEKSGLVKELGMNKNSILNEFKQIDWKGCFLRPLSEFTRYYILTPPKPPLRLPAEFEPAGAIYMGWPMYDYWLWNIHVDLVKEIKEAADAWIFVPNEHWQKAIQLYLTRKGVTLENVRFLHIPTDGCWARNWGQLTVFSGEEKAPVFICEHYVGYAFQPYAKKSAKAAIAFGQYMDVPVYQLPLVCEQGGNIITDGNGTIVITPRIFQQNPDVGRSQFEKILKDYYGCKQIIVIPNLKGEVNGHTDHIKFADPHTIFVCRTPEDSLWHETLEEAVRILSGAKSADGEKYKIIRIPMPSNCHHGKDSIGWNYNCSLTANKKIIVPVYDAPEDEEALRIYRESLPGYKVVGLNFKPYLSGAINCGTLEVPPEVTGRMR